MATDSAALIVQCQMALGLTQKELADLVGRTKRTIQRWQGRGCMLLPEEAEAIANAVRPVRPDLAEEVLLLGRASDHGAGAAQPCIPATTEVIDAILRAAADAATETPPGAIHAAVAAAFAEARDQGVEVLAVLAGLDAGR